MNNIGYPLSSWQKELWNWRDSNLSLFTNANFVYRGKIEKDLLIETVKDVFEGHLILNSERLKVKHFFFPLQKVTEKNIYEINFFDYHQIDNSRRLELQQFLKGRKKIDGGDDKFDISIFTVSENLHLICARLSSFICDAHSVLRIVNEIFLRYEGSVDRLGTIEFNFFNYCNWQEEILKKSQNIKRFSDALPSDQFSSNGIGLEKRPIESSKASTGRIGFIINESQRNDLLASAKAKHTTPDQLIYTCWILTLWKFQDFPEQLSIVKMMNCRTHQELKDVIGPLTYPISERFEFNRESSFEDVLRDVQRSNIESLESCHSHSHTPSGEAADIIFYKYGYEFTRFRSRSELNLSSLQTIGYPFRLKLSCIDKSEEVELKLYYDQAFWERDNIVLINKSFRMLLEKVIKNEVGTLHHLLIGHNSNVVTRNKSLTETENRSIIKRFENCAKQNSNKFAVISQERNLTYQTLDRLANCFANFLITNGVREGNIIPVNAAKHENTLIAILGILKTGSSYLPIDPQTPLKRINYIIEDCNASLIVDPCKEWGEGLNVDQVLTVDQDALLTVEEYQRQLNFSNVANAAYVIYTSGSTGRPKGVVVANSSLVNYCEWFIDTFDICPDDSTVVLSSLAFDLSYSSLWPTLVSGGTVLFPEYSRYFEAETVRLLLKKHNITFLKLTPSHFRILISDLKFKENAAFPNLRLIVLGGEAIIPKDIKDFLKASPHVRFVNHYGPTETTIGSVATEIVHGKLDSFMARPVIGRPINNTEVFILDAHGNAMPNGIKGEIAISGRGLAIGYLNEPELTHSRFDYINEIRIYKTGDVGRRLADNSIELLGRNDDQLKINGFRVEPLEIAKRLSEHPSVKEAVVLGDGGSSEVTLIAFYLSDQQINASVLATFLREFLSEIAIPKNYIRISELPLTPNGKIDRVALIRKKDSMSVEPVEIVALSNNELLLVDAWKNVLGQGNVGLLSNFFELGGDSIKAVQIAGRIYEKGYKLEIKDIFNLQTIAAIARKILPLNRETEQQPVSGEVSLLPMQRYFFKYHNVDQYNQGLVAKMRTKVDLDMLNQVFDKIIMHHDILRARFTRDGDEVKQIITLTPQPILVDFRASADVSFEVLVNDVSSKLQNTIGLQAPSLIKAAVIKHQDDSFLIIIIHHLIMDYFSWRIILKDIDLIYSSLIEQHEVPVLHKTHSIEKWINGLMSFSKSELFHDEMKYWNRLNETKSIPLFEADQVENGYMLEENYEEFFFALTKEETADLMSKVNFAYNTQINDVLITALVIALKKLVGSDEIQLVVEGHGREAVFSNADYSRTIGWFTSMFPVKLNPKKPSIGEQLVEIKEQLRKVPNNGFGFNIFSFLTKDGDAGNNLFESCQVRFNYLGQFDQDIKFKCFELITDINLPMIDPKCKRKFLIDVVGAVTDAKLKITLQFNRNQFRREDIERLATDYRKILQDIITHCINIKNTINTPSDFSFKNLSQGSLMEITNLFLSGNTLRKDN